MFQAIEAVKNSIEIFEGENNISLPVNVTSNHQNMHGLALAEFQLGHLYEVHADILGHKPSGANVEIGLDQLLMKSPEECMMKASKHYDNSFGYFQRLNHLKGQIYAKTHSLITTNGDSVDD